MDENTVADVSAVETTTDAFLEGWEDTSPAAVAEAPAAKEETPKDGEAAEPAAETPAATEPAPAETPSAAADEASWEIKYMGEQRTMKASEVTPELLQKALDYDRVRGKYDESKPVMDMFAQFAKQAGMNVPDYVAFIRQQTKMNGGMSEAEAKRAVELEDREAAVAVKEAVQKEEADARAREQAKIQADLAEFKRNFPEAYEKAEKDPKAIPEEVWADVNSGKLSLTGAYSQWAVRQARAEAAAAAKAAATEQQNAANAARSTGSMKSAGSDAASKDPFIDGWNSLD